jgi:hypothetical protein
LGIRFVIAANRIGDPIGVHRAPSQRFYHAVAWTDHNM